jgi:hypothetical protein
MTNPQNNSPVTEQPHNSPNKTLWFVVGFLAFIVLAGLITIIVFPIKQQSSLTATNKNPALAVKPAINYLANLTNEDIEKLQESAKYPSLVKHYNLCNRLTAEAKPDCLEQVQVQQVYILDNPNLCSGLENNSDTCFQNMAFQNKDLNLCSNIIDSSSKDFCTDLINHNLALNSNNINICDDIIDNNRKEDCINGVISQQNDLSYCANEYIAANNLYIQCHSIILSKQALLNNDPTLCEQIPLESAKQSCLNEL